MWAEMASWYTPTSLFLFLNLVIGTIVITTHFTTHKPQQQQQHNHPQLARVPSLFKYSFKSFKSFSFYTPEQEQQQQEQQEQQPQPPPTTSTPEGRDSTQEPNPSPDPNLDVGHEPSDHHVTRIVSEPKPAETGKAEVTMKKSASEKMEAAREEEEVVERRRPATVRERSGGGGKETVAFGEEEEGVDAKAADFIHRFKQQLKLQRLDSLLRYKEMLTRGGSGKLG